MGLLADIFSYGDTQKRRLRGLLDDPAGTLGLGATRAVEDQNGLLGLMDQAGYTPGSKSVLLDKKKQAQTALSDKAMETFGGLLGAAAWHGPLLKNDMTRSDIQDLISSQRFLDRDIVAKKIRDSDFTVRVTPKFILDGRNVRAITDGHHALEASIRSGNKPKFITDTATSNDRVGLIKNKKIDDYLESAYHDSPWYQFASKTDLF